ncbi:MAG: selenium-binding family protein [Gemmatimonadaceae bacterium]|nr:selenium-binding family protein [Gemmatimonadaceae bacterium]
MLRRTLLSSALAACAIAPVALRAQAKPAAPSRYLYLWTASADTTLPDFLAVVDVAPQSPTYGKLVTTVPVPGRANWPHHTEHELAADGRLFANGFDGGKTFIFDLKTPAAPSLFRTFGDVQGMMHPHSFLRLANGNVLATFQMRHANGKTLPGGLAELTNTGAVVRTANANGPGVDPRVRPYSAAIMPTIDRVFTTTTDMDGKDEINDVQLWKLSDLTLLKTFKLPNGPRGNEGALTAEPRLLPDGKSLLVSTFNCGLYHVSGLDTPNPTAKLVASFPQKPKTYCAIPSIVGHYYVVTVPAYSAVVSLDIRDPLHPKEVSRVAFGKDDVPHWLSVEPNHQRIVVTGYAGMQHRVMMLTFNEQTGQLALDTRFREPASGTPGFFMDNKTWPHGGSAKGIPHGAVFSR